eukprot:141960_1
MTTKSNNLLPYHKQFPNKFRSQTIFGQYEKIYRRPITLKKNSKEFIKLQTEEKIKLSKVLDLHNMANNEQIHKQNIKLISSKNDIKMYEYSTFNGLYLIPNYLSTKQQFEWIKQSVQQFSNAPYNNLTNLYKNTNVKIPTWEQCIKQNNYKQFRQLTWSNVGIQYDWTDRKYNLNNITAPIPNTMLNLCNDCNDLLKNIPSQSHGIDDDSKQYENGMIKDENGLTFCMEMIPQTSIINFFEVNTKRPMGGHRDAAELINAPLVSVSLGNRAIFLISKDDNIEPLPLWLQSGDVLIMAGKARFALHCVARVVSGSCPDVLIEYFDKEIEKENNEVGKQEFMLMKKYIMESRINFNIRQVIDVDKLPLNTHNELREQSSAVTVDFHEMHSF